MTDPDGRAAGPVIREITPPETTESESFEDFAAVQRLFFEIEALTYGTHDVAYEPAETIDFYQDQENQPTRLFGAWIGGLAVARGYLELEPGDTPTTSWIDVSVAHEARHTGLGTELADLLEGYARDAGAAKAIVYAASPAGPGEQIVPPTGFGSVPADSSTARFLVGRGYRLEQIARASRLALPVDVAGRLESTLAAVDGEYALHTWIDHTPDRWLEDFAMLRTRMSTEEPGAGLDEPEDVWTVERVRDTEDRADASPLATLVAAVEHVPSGHLAGFTSLAVPASPTRSVHQLDTLVLPEHRGHRLGMLLKVANIDFLQTARGGHPSIVTYNAEENRYMLDVNEAVGFVPIGYDGAWRKDF